VYRLHSPGLYLHFIRIYLVSERLLSLCSVINLCSFLVVRGEGIVIVFVLTLLMCTQKHPNISLNIQNLPNNYKRPYFAVSSSIYFHVIPVYDRTNNITLTF
jgi:hypothetical protein